MPTYTVVATASPITRDPEEGPLIELVVSVLKDAAQITRFTQMYGEALDNATIQEDVASKVREIVADDYAQEQQADKQTRCDALAAVVSAWVQILP